MGRKLTKKRKQYQQQAFLFFGIAFIGFLLVLWLLLSPVTPLNEENADQVRRENFFASVLEPARANQLRYGVKTSVTMAQAALESDFGTSQLASRYYNLFGVKGNATNGVLLPTLEYVDGAWQSIDDYFKVYANWGESIAEHGALMNNGVSWNATLYHGVIKATTYQEAANALMAAGYATDPTYAQKLIQLIEQYRLYRYD